MPVPAEPLAVAVSLSTNEARIGDLVEVTVTAYHPTGSTVRVPDLSRGRELSVRERRVTTRRVAPDRLATTVALRVAPFRIGEYVLSTGTVACTLADGQTLETPFPDARLTVRSLLVGTNTTWRDIKGPLAWPPACPRWVWVLVLVAAAALLAGLAARKLWQRPSLRQPGPPPRPPHEVALEALRALWAKGLAQKGEAEPFYVELSGIVRKYLEDRFGLRAPEQTTEEFIRDAVTSQALTAAHQDLVRNFLEQSDLVKFARHQPTWAEMRAAYAAAERLIVETIPRPETAASEARPE